VNGGGGRERKRGKVEGEGRRRTIEVERKHNFQEKQGEHKKEQNEYCDLVFQNASSLNAKTGQQPLRCAVIGKRDGSQNEQDVQR
jgi:hypothetical protein